jgi:hypothetical protein
MNYNINQTITALEPLVGFESSEGFTLPTSLTATSLKMNSYHPLLQLSILDNVRPEDLSLSTFLTSIRKSSITSLLNDVMTKKLSAHSIKTKLSDTQVFDSTARFSNLLSKRGRFVGWVFRPVRSEHTFHKIPRIAIQTSLSQTGIPIYVYHSSQKEPIQMVTINSTGNSGVTWTDLETPLLLNYLEYDAGGFYYIGYYEEDLDVNNQAIYKDHDLSKLQCGTCNPFNTRAYKDWSKYISISTAYVEGSKLDGSDMVSVEDVEIENINNYGLNFRIESYCDITKFLTENKSIMTPALQVRYAIDLMRYIEMSALRANKVTDQLKDQAFVAINGQKSENGFVKIKGLIHDYDDYLKGLNFDLSKIDPVCLPSKDRSISWNR